MNYMKEISFFLPWSAKVKPPEGWILKLFALHGNKP